MILFYKLIPLFITFILNLTNYYFSSTNNKANNGISTEIAFATINKESCFTTLSTNEFSFYPNLASIILLINCNLKNDKFRNISIINNHGSVVLVQKARTSSTNVRLDISSLQPGHYTIVVFDDYKKLTQYPFIKQ